MLLPRNISVSFLTKSVWLRGVPIKCRSMGWALRFAYREIAPGVFWLDCKLKRRWKSAERMEGLRIGNRCFEKKWTSQLMLHHSHCEATRWQLQLERETIEGVLDARGEKGGGKRWGEKMRRIGPRNKSRVPSSSVPQLPRIWHIGINLRKYLPFT